jgi:hypothetical protein
MVALGLVQPMLLAHGMGAAMGQGGGLFDPTTGRLTPPDWSGFLDTHFMIDSLAALALATVLAALIGYHPMTPRTVDTLSEADMPKVHIMYAFVAAVIGLAVREFGMVIGFIVFGLGGLIRFRTDAGSARDTGRLIVVTLVGLVAGLGLPALAVITTAFVYCLIFLFDARPASRVRVEALPEGQLIAAAAAYRGVLEGQGCKIISERKSFTKSRVDFVIRPPRATNRDHLHAALCEVHTDVRGEVGWEVE